jgi:hypothetical protein
MLRRMFTAHPASVGETYSEHFMVAFTIGLRMAMGAAVCLVHALLPFLFVTTGSRIITDLHARAVSHRRTAGKDDSQDGNPDRQTEVPA